MIVVERPDAPHRFWATRAPRTEDPTRYRLGDIRLYPIPSHNGNGYLAVPGVTSFLSFSDTPEDRQRLVDWRERELAAGRNPNAGRERGTRVHGLLERYIRTGQFGDCDESDALFAQAMAPHLDDYTEFIWNEQPLRLGWEHCWSAPKGHPGRLARVWSSVWGFAGTPDLVAKHKDGAHVLSDFKTSNQPYYRPTGGPVPPYAQTGYKKFCKTVKQLCAYRLAIKETLGLDIDRLQIIVGLPKGKSQNFVIEGPLIDQETERFQKLVLHFWESFSFESEQERLAPYDSAA